MSTKTDVKTNGNRDWALSPIQEQAADMLALGSTLQAAADTLKLERSTVSRWFNHHLGFRAAYNRRRAELWSEMSERMRSLISPALDVVTACLTNPEVKTELRLRAAETVLKAGGLDALILPDPDECSVEALEIAAVKLTNRLSREKLTAECGG